MRARRWPMACAVALVMGCANAAPASLEGAEGFSDPRTADGSSASDAAVNMPDAGAPSVTSGASGRGVDADGVAAPTPDATFQETQNCIGEDPASFASATGESIDCTLEACGGLSSCCIGNGDCCEPVSPSAPPNFEACGGANDVGACLASLGLAPFGAPEVDGGWLYPGAGPAPQGGISASSALDLRARRAEWSADFAFAPDCGLDCEETLGLGWTQTDPLAAQVVMNVGLVYSGARSAMRLFVAGDPVAQWTVEGGTTERWGLLVRPDGRLDVLRDGATVLRETFVPVAEARLVVAGRNRASGIRAAVGAITIGTGLCDMPTAWLERRPLTVRSAADVPLNTSEIVDVTVAVAAGETHLGFVRDGGFYLAAETAAGEFKVASDTPLLQGIEDPELLVVGDELWLYYASASGIRRAVAPLNTMAFEVSMNPVVQAAHLEDASAIDGPTVARAPSGLWVMVVRASLGGQWRFVPLRSTDGITWEPVADSLLPLLRIDGDEPSDPSLLIHHGAWQLYYAVRTGARSHVALALSDEIVYWRHAESRGAVLEPGPTFDAIGLFSPDHHASGSMVTQYYLGSDGAARTLARITRVANPI